MRQLNPQERQNVKHSLAGKAKVISIVMTFLGIFGLFQIGAVVCYILSGDVAPEGIPFLVVACVLLYLVYFKFAGWLARKNQWRCLLELVRKKKEYVFEGELIHLYKTREGDDGAKVLMAVVEFNGKELRTNASRELEGVALGTRVALVCTKELPEMGFVYVTGIIK